MRHSKDIALKQGKNIFVFNKYHFVLLIATIFFGTYYVMARYLVLDGLDPYLLPVGRIAAASLLLTAVLFVRKDKPKFAELKQNFKPLLAMSLTGVAGFSWFSGIALAHTLAGQSSLIVATNSLFIIVFARIFLKEKLNKLQIFGIVLAVVGVLVAVTNGQIQNQFTIADLLLLLSALVWATYTLLSRQFGLRLPFLHTLFWIFLLGTIISLLLCIPHIGSVTAVSLKQWLILVYIGFGPGLMGFMCWNTGIRQVGAAMGGVMNSFMPIFSIVFASILLQERLGPIQLLGTALVVGGVLLSLNKSGQDSQQISAAAK